MTVRAAVAKRDEATAEVVAAHTDRPPLHQLAAQAIERQAVVLAKILPQHMTRDRFEQTTLAAIKATPKLLRCFETAEGQVSVLYSVIRAAAAGLELGGISPEAWLIPFEQSYRTADDRWAKRWEARLQISDRGVRDIGRRDDRVRELKAGVVREGDLFVHRTTLDGDVFEHEVRGPSDRPLTHAYCLIRWREGGALPIVLDRHEVLSIRDRYSDGYRADLAKPADKRTNPWITREARMWAKTAIHQALRELNATPEVHAALAAEADPSPDPATWAAELEPIDLPELDAPPAAADAPPAPADVDQALAELEASVTAAQTARGRKAKPEPEAEQVTAEQLLAAVAALMADPSDPARVEAELLDVAESLIGWRPATVPELVAAQDQADELLAKLTPAAQ